MQYKNAPKLPIQSAVLKFYIHGIFRLLYIFSETLKLFQ